MLDKLLVDTVTLNKMKLATGGAKPKKHNSGVNLDAAKGMTQLDWHLQESNQKPGPGKYGGSIHMCMHNTHTHTHTHTQFEL